MAKQQHPLKKHRATLIAAAVIAIFGVAYFTPLGGPMSMQETHYRMGSEEIVMEMRNCIAEKGLAACTRIQAGAQGRSMSIAGKLAAPCQVATYAPGANHDEMVQRAEAGCYIAVRGRNYCAAVKGEADTTYCADSRDGGGRRSYCLVTGACTQR